MDQAVITVKEPEVFGCEGGSGAIMYSIENPREGVGPEVSCEESWISGLSAGEGRITFTLSVNESVKSRKGTISISYMEAEPVSVEITQAGQEQSVIKVENPEAEFDYNGGSGSVKYSIEKPREGDKLQATCSDSWITGITVGSCRRHAAIHGLPASLSEAAASHSRCRRIRTRLKGQAKYS